MVCWNHYAHYQYAYIKGNLIISSTIDGVTRFHPPIGLKDVDLLKAVIQLAIKENNTVLLEFIENDSADWIKSVFPTIEFVPDRDQFDYVYRAQDLADLTNSSYQSIRRVLNKFKANYSYQMECVSPSNSIEVKKFLDKWYMEKKNGLDQILQNEKKAILFCIDHFEDLNMSGLLIRINGEIGAISIYDTLNVTTALIHFEKGLNKYDGIYKAINAETARVLATRYQYINREGDMGNRGLRIAKTHYHPYNMVKVFLMQNSLEIAFL